jgi:hypothetical protein
MMKKQSGLLLYVAGCLMLLMVRLPAFGSPAFENEQRTVHRWTATVFEGQSGGRTPDPGLEVVRNWGVVQKNRRCGKSFQIGGDAPAPQHVSGHDLARKDIEVQTGEKPTSWLFRYEKSAVKPAEQRRGFYLHACWMYNYPFAVRTWQREDYGRMFQLLKRLGYNTVMLWPCTEAAPAPISGADRRDLLKFRQIIADGRKHGLETWLATCAVGVKPEIAAKPWMQRSLWPHMETARMDDPKKAEAFLKHRSALIEILNNADAYVTIDGDPGSYPGAKPEDFAKIMQHDRETIERVGTHPKTQKVIPWIWAGWGRTEPLWQGDLTPYSRAAMTLLKQRLPEPWLMMPGRSTRSGWANGRINVALAEELGLIDRSMLMCYEAIEFEPTPPAGVLQFNDIRRILKEEGRNMSRAAGVMANAQQPIMVLPNIYLFTRGAQNPKYLDEPDDKILADLAELLGGPPNLLVPAWSCLQRGLDRLPPDLPSRLRAVKLTGPLAPFVPGGAARYLEILAVQADTRIHLLQIGKQSPKTPEEAAEAVAEGTAALVNWWNQNRYCALGLGTEPFNWGLVHSSFYGGFKEWCIKNVADPAKVSGLAVQKIVTRGILNEPSAKDRLRELLAR